MRTYCLTGGDGQIHESTHRDGLHGDGRVCHPVVVIDPENDVALDRLCKVLVEAMHRAGEVASAANGVHPATVATALREFATPTPSKPDEPTGLGAVVEDASGQLWVRTHHHWRREDLAGIAWDDLSAVRVLSEGVVADA